MVHEWLKRDELTAELFDMLDAIHKGYSFTEIVWDTSEGQWSPDRLEWRDPRWFDFERWDLRTPQLITEAGGREPLPAGKFVFAPMAAKSGIPTRSGLSRVLSWVWMFKAFSSRDWAIFSQTYGQPVRVGKFGQGASEDDKRTLLRAVANIAGDMAAIIPASMAIDFVESSNVGAGSDLYEKRVTHLNLEASKAVLGQTTTTDAVSGGHAVSQEHRLVQEDIERSDCRQLAAHLNRDLIKIWINLEFGPQSAYPRLRIGRPERRDVAATVAAVRSLGLPVKRSEMYALVGVSEPESGDDVLVPGGAEPADAGIGEDGPGRPRLPGRQPPPAPPREQLHAERTDPGRTEAERLAAAVDRLAERGEDAGAGAMELMLELIGDMIADPTIRDLEDLRARLLTLAPSLSTRALATAMRQAMVLADLSGRADLIDGPGA
jgi:phage gp29-like protein